MYFSKVVSALGALAVASAIPLTKTEAKRSVLDESACSNPAPGLSEIACKLMAAMPFASMGKNSDSNNNIMWVGNDGPNTFAFTNGGNEDVTVVGWDQPPGLFSAMDMNVSPAQVTYTLSPGKSVTISLANGISGAFAGLYADTKMVDGQVSESWLEYTTGDSATIDVSREVNMNGKSISATVSGSGCKTDMDTCVFKCNSGSTCGLPGSYSLDNCSPGSQNGANYGTFLGQASGGCTGFSNGGHVDVVMNGNGGPPPAPSTTASPTPTPTPTPSTSSTPTPTPTIAQFIAVTTSAAATTSTTMATSTTPTPTPTHTPMSVEGIPGQPLREFSEAFVRAFRGI